MGDVTMTVLKCLRTLKLKLGGVSGFLPAVCTQRTAESDAWTLHRAIPLGNNNSGDSKSVSDYSEGDMASHLHDDASDLGREKSEEIWKDWNKYWTAVETDKTDGILSVTQGQSIIWDSQSTNGKAAKNESNGQSLAKKADRRWILTMRHGERVDLTYGHWVNHCFDENGTYIRKDLNLPLTLGERAGGADSYYKDTPLTRIGHFQAQLVGEGLRLAGVTVKHVYASAALRCVETAHSLLQGLQADPSIKIKVEPGLFEYKGWHVVKGLAPFMTPLEFHKAGYNVDLSYKPYLELDTNSTETFDDFFKRNEEVIQTAVRDTDAEGGNIIFVGHAATLELMTIALERAEKGDKEPYTYQISKNLLRVPYCALGAMKDKPFEMVSPPCPPSINSSSGRFDWRILQNP